MIETPRLTLRAYTDGDAARVLDIRSRIDVVKWLTDPPHLMMTDLDDARRWIGRERAKAHDPLGTERWAIEVRGTGLVAGSVSLSRLPHGDDDVEAGWHLHPDSAGHGYATEAAAAALTAGLARGLPGIWVLMYPGNAPSARVAERLGLERVGLITRWYESESLAYRCPAGWSAPPAWSG